MNTSRAKLVERDGYAPSPPHCKCGVLLLSLRPQDWTRRRDLHPRPSALQAGPLAARARRDGNHTAAQVTRPRKTSRSAVLSDRGLRLVEPAGLAPAPCGLKVGSGTFWNPVVVGAALCRDGSDETATIAA